MSKLVGDDGDRGTDEGGASFVGGGEMAAAGDFGFDSVLRGDLKGWERVVVAVLRRRRLEG